MLNSGSNVVQTLLKEGVIEWNDQDMTRLALFLFDLRDDGSVTFTDNGLPVRGPNRTPGLNDLNIAGQIRVTSHGRIAAQTSRPSIAIGQLALGNITNLDLSVLIGEIESRVEASEADEATKQEARSRLGMLRERAANVGTGAAGDLIGSALRQVLGLA